MENYKTVTPKSSPDRFREVVVYTSFHQYGFDWEKFCCFGYMVAWGR